ncbi:MAG TPA: hypothetical protein VGC29_02815 [Flavisolibacter sp.]
MKTKKLGLLVWIAAAFLLNACGSGQENDEHASPNVPGVQNVNGNIPDTINTIELDGRQSIDSTNASDSVKPNF